MKVTIRRVCMGPRNDVSFLDSISLFIFFNLGTTVIGSCC